MCMQRWVAVLPSTAFSQLDCATSCASQGCTRSMAKGGSMKAATAGEQHLDNRPLSPTGEQLIKDAAPNGDAGGGDSILGTFSAPIPCSSCMPSCPFIYLSPARAPTASCTICCAHTPSNLPCPPMLACTNFSHVLTSPPVCPVVAGTRVNYLGNGIARAHL